MTDPKPGDLAIFVRAEGVEVECKACIDSDYPGRIYNNNDTTHVYSDCPQCNGSGTRTVTLAGWCEVIDWSDYACSSHPDFCLSCRGIHGARCHTKEEARQYLHDQITQALHDNTCPDEIRAQLSEVEK